MKHIIAILCILALLLTVGCASPQYAIHYDDISLYVTPVMTAKVGEMVQIRLNTAESASFYIYADGVPLSPHDIDEYFTTYEFAMPNHDITITHAEGETQQMSTISIPASMTCHRISYETPYAFGGKYDTPYRFDGTCAVITNSAEASALFSGFSLMYPEQIQPYPAGFFDNYAIIAFLKHEGSGSTTHSLESAKIEDGVLTLTVNREVPQIGTCDMASWLCLVTVSKHVATQSYTVKIAVQDKNT